MSRATPQALVLSGSWTALGMGRLTSELDSLAALAGEHWVIDASGIEALDTAGAWILQTLLRRLRRLRDGAAGVELRQLRPEFARLFDALAQEAAPGPTFLPRPLSRLESLGQGTVTLLAQGCALLAFGSMLGTAMQVGEELDATVANMRFVKPIDADLIVELAGNHSLLVTLEENAVIGGAGSEVERVLAERGLNVPVLRLGLPDRFIDHGEQGQLLAELGLDKDGIVHAVRSRTDKR